MLGTQPLTQPLAGVLVHRPVGLADRAQTEVIGSSRHNELVLSYHRRDDASRLVERAVAICSGAVASHQANLWRCVSHAQVGEVRQTQPPLQPITFSSVSFIARPLLTCAKKARRRFSLFILIAMPLV